VHHISHPPDPPWFYHPTNFLGGVQIKKNFSSAPYYFLTLISTQLPQHPILKHPQPMLFP
jgi:hypothetical protein